MAVLLVVGCGKKPSADANETETYQDIEGTFDDSEPAAADKKPVEGAELGALSATDKKRFENLVDKLPSPCGKAHSLRTSRNTDAECLRAPFAVSYVVALLGDGATNADVQEFYDYRYGEEAMKKHGFKLSADTPHTGPTDAPVVMVEFFDYGCPACARFEPIVSEVAQAFPTDFVVYYKMYPLAAHPNSGPAAQAALAAAAQGKFKEMHSLLFANQQAHSLSDLKGYAEQIGLDMQRFDADFAAAKAKVASDRREGDEAGVQGTPSTYINGRSYQGPDAAKYLKMWVEEELALSR